MPGQVNEREPEAGPRGLQRFGIAEVKGPSMVPTLLAGDQVIVQYGAAVRAGDIVVLRHPFQQDLLLIKRAVERRDGGWWVQGENRFVENDSREYGVVPDSLIVARAHARLRPPRELQRSVRGVVSWAFSAVRPLSWRLRAR